MDRESVTAHDANGGEVQVSLKDAEPVCYVFKTMSEAQFGELSFFGFTPGSVKFGSELYNSDRRDDWRRSDRYIY